MIDIKNEPLRIAARQSKTWTVEDWRAIDFTQEAGWQRAIEIFEDRIRGRFIDVAEHIEHLPAAGFAIMAIDSLLIETLQQFREGVDKTPSRQGERYFREFLTQTLFGGYFNEEQANAFYDQIRCGILHSAESKQNSRILTRSSVPLVDRLDDGSLVINRRKFHAVLLQVFDAYLVALRKNDPPDQELRKKFKKKMSNICKAAIEDRAQP